MSKLLDALREHKIFNTHGLLEKFGGPRAVAISYYPPERHSYSKSKVWAVDHKTDPSANAHWADYGCKTFSGKRSVSLPEAIEWAKANYGITEWVPFNGDMVPKEVLKRAKQFLKSGPDSTTE